MPSRRIARRALPAIALAALAACGRRPEASIPPPNASAAPVPAGASNTAAPAATVPAVTPAPTVVPTAVATAPLPNDPPAPDFDGGGAWLNSEPLTLAGLRGTVVLVNFWTYSCYNCNNTLPYVRQWWERYHEQPFVIVGVHTPEFRSEHELENVRAAVAERQIEWPVVQDNDYAIWRAYNNRYWPRFYLVDHRGAIVYDHIGEGAYEETERQIQAALERIKDKG